MIQQLLKEAGAANVASSVVTVQAQGAEAAADMAQVASPETYVGYGRAENFRSPGGLANDVIKDYVAAPLKLNDWSLSGRWRVTREHADLQTAGGRIAFRFKARDLHLVIGPSKPGVSVRFRVRIDGAAPGANAGSDINAQGLGRVDGERLYQWCVRRARCANGRSRSSSWIPAFRSSPSLSARADRRRPACPASTRVQAAGACSAGGRRTAPGNAPSGRTRPGRRPRSDRIGRPA